MKSVEEANRCILQISNLVDALANEQDINAAKTKIAKIYGVDMNINGLFDGTPEIAVNIIISDVLLEKINSELPDYYRFFNNEKGQEIATNWKETVKFLQAEKEALIDEWNKQGGVKTVDVDAIHERFQGVIDILSQIDD